MALLWCPCGVVVIAMQARGVCGGVVAVAGVPQARRPHATNHDSLHRGLRGKGVGGGRETKIRDTVPGCWPTQSPARGMREPHVIVNMEALCVKCVGVGDGARGQVACTTDHELDFSCFGLAGFDLCRHVLEIPAAKCACQRLCSVGRRGTLDICNGCNSWEA